MLSNHACPSAALALHVATHSNCPSGLWHDRISSLLQVPHMVILNIGANKGYNLVDYAQRYTETNVTKRAWLRLLTHASPPCVHTCGGQCNAAYERKQKPAAGAERRRLELHAFEVMPANSELLQQLVAATGLPAEVHRVAVGNASSGSIFIPVLGSGSERASVSLAPPPATSTSGSSSTGKQAGGGVQQLASVPMTTVDAFMTTRRITRTQFVSIDTEGFDGLVLQGMQRTLSERRVDIIEFEYSVRWFKWLGRQGLQHTLDGLLMKGYSCFWQDRRGQLAEASGACWSEPPARLMERPPYRNLVCSHRQDVLQVFRNLDVAVTCKVCDSCACAATSSVCKKECKK